jgi:hypothetical protein
VAPSPSIAGAARRVRLFPAKRAIKLRQRSLRVFARASTIDGE